RSSDLLYMALHMITRGSGSRPGGRMVTPTYRTESTSSVHALRTLLILAVSLSRGVRFISRTGPCPRTTRVRGRAAPGRTAALQGAWTAPGPASGDDAGPGAGRAAGEKVPLRPLSERAGRRRTPGPTGARRRWRR